MEFNMSAKEPFRNVSTRLLTSLARIQIRTRKLSFFTDIKAPHTQVFFSFIFFFYFALYTGCENFFFSESPASVSATFPRHWFLNVIEIRNLTSSQSHGKPILSKTKIFTPLKQKAGKGGGRRDSASDFDNSDILNLLSKMSFAGNNSWNGCEIDDETFLSFFYFIIIPFFYF